MGLETLDLTAQVRIFKDMNLEKFDFRLLPGVIRIEFVRTKHDHDTGKEREQWVEHLQRRAGRHVLVEFHTVA